MSNQDVRNVLSITRQGLSDLSRIGAIRFDTGLSSRVNQLQNFVANADGMLKQMQENAKQREQLEVQTPPFFEDACQKELDFYKGLISEASKLKSAKAIKEALSREYGEAPEDYQTEK